LINTLRFRSAARLSLLTALICLNGNTAIAQIDDTVWQGRPKVVSAVDLIPRTRMDTWVELQDGLDYSFRRWRTGAVINRRVKPILNLRLRDIDEDNDHFLVFGGGYEYLHTIRRGMLFVDHSIIAYATPHILVAGLLLSDRNRIESRWINGVYDFRYRNRVTIIRQSQVGTFRFAPYAYGEIFYNSIPDSWNQREYATGVQFPYRPHLMLDTYLLHESCTTCSHHSINMIGVTLNIYWRQLQ